MSKNRTKIMSASKPRVFSYLRFSSPDQATGDSWRRQDRDRQSWCERHCMTLDETLTFEDPGISAFRGRHRAQSMQGEGGFTDFLAAIEAGLVPPGSVLLVERLDLNGVRRHPSTFRCSSAKTAESRTLADRCRHAAPRSASAQIRVDDQVRTVRS